MIAAKMTQSINEQINKEMYSAYLYMAMSAKASELGYIGTGKWLMAQYHEEMYHAMKFFAYLLDQNSTIELKTISKPEVNETTIKSMFEHILEHEKSVTKSINTIMELAIETGDYASMNLLRWYIDEQVEEEKNGTAILTDIKLFGDSPQSTLMIDAKLGERKPAAPLDFTEEMNE